jgi:hypothetical protein
VSIIITFMGQRVKPRIWRTKAECYCVVVLGGVYSDSECLSSIGHGITPQAAYDDWTDKCGQAIRDKYGFFPKVG